MRTLLVATCLSLACLATVSAQDAKNIEKLSADCSKKGDTKTCDKLYAAVRRVTDRALLAKIAVESTDPVARRTAVVMIEDQAVLASIARNERDAEVRKTAIERLSDQAVLTKIAHDDADVTARRAAVGKLTDQAGLIKIAQDDADATVRGAALDKVTDQAVLARIAREGSNLDVRIAAVEHITNQTLLSEMVTDDRLTTADGPHGAANGNVVRAGAVLRVEDKSLLTKAKGGDASGAVRFAAEVRLMRLDGQRVSAVPGPAPPGAKRLGGIEYQGRIFATHVAEVTSHELTGDFAALTGADRAKVIEALVKEGMLSPLGSILVFNLDRVVGWTSREGVEGMNNATELKFAIIGDRLCVREGSGGYRLLAFGSR
jgi:hypothetical protein